MVGDRPALRRIVFVCTGNTCRSPLAEAVCKQLLAGSLQCSVPELPGKGFVVSSAGVMTWPGLPASFEAEAAGRDVGLDLSTHQSQPVNPELLATATDVIAMTAEHVAMLEQRFPSLGPTPKLLAGAEDLQDPIGADAQVYRACLATIHHHLTRHLKDWLPK